MATIDEHGAHHNPMTGKYAAKPAPENEGGTNALAEMSLVSDIRDDTFETHPEKVLLTGETFDAYRQRFTEILTVRHPEAMPDDIAEVVHQNAVVNYWATIQQVVKSDNTVTAAQVDGLIEPHRRYLEQNYRNLIERKN